MGSGGSGGQTVSDGVWRVWWGLVGLAGSGGSTSQTVDGRGLAGLVGLAGSGGSASQTLDGRRGVGGAGGWWRVWWVCATTAVGLDGLGVCKWPSRGG